MSCGRCNGDLMVGNNWCPSCGGGTEELMPDKRECIVLYEVHDRREIRVMAASEEGAREAFLDGLDIEVTDRSVEIVHSEFLTAREA